MHCFGGSCFDWDAKSRAPNNSIKVKKQKVVDMGPHIVLDQEHCVSLQHWVGKCDEVAGTHQLEDGPAWRSPRGC